MCTEYCVSVFRVQPVSSEKPHSPTFAPHMPHIKAASCMSQVPGGMLPARLVLSKLPLGVAVLLAASTLEDGWLMKWGCHPQMASRQARWLKASVPCSADQNISSVKYIVARQIMATPKPGSCT